MAIPIIVPLLAAAGIGLVALARSGGGKKKSKLPAGPGSIALTPTKGDPGPYRVLSRSEAMRTPKLAALWATMMPGESMPSDAVLDAKVREVVEVGTMVLIAMENTQTHQSFLKGAKVGAIQGTTLGIPIYVATIDNAGAKVAEKGAELFVDDGGPADGTVVKFGPPQVIET